jgi:hypothetical protein
MSYSYHFCLGFLFNSASKKAINRTKKGHPVMNNNHIRFKTGYSTRVYDPVKWVNGMQPFIYYNSFRRRIIGILRFTGKKQTGIKKPERNDLGLLALRLTSQSK